MKRTSILSLILFIGCIIAAAFAVENTQVRNTDDGYVIAETAAQKVAFHGATPVAQRSGSAQAAVTTTVGSAVAGTAATNSTPYGYSQAQADAIVANVNSLRTDVLALTTLVNELRAALVAKGIIKGSS